MLFPTSSQLASPQRGEPEREAKAQEAPGASAGAEHRFEGDQGGNEALGPKDEGHQTHEAGVLGVLVVLVVF